MCSWPKKGLVISYLYGSQRWAAAGQKICAQLKVQNAEVNTLYLIKIHISLKIIFLLDKFNKIV